MKIKETENNVMQNVFDSFQLFITDYIDDSIQAMFKQYIACLNNKEYYSLKEFADMFGLTVHAVKGRYRRGTLKVVYSDTTPLIPKDEVRRFREKLKNQIS